MRNIFYTDDDLYEKLLDRYPNPSLPKEPSAPVTPVEPAPITVETRKTKKSLGKKLRAPSHSFSRSGDDLDRMSVSEEKSSLNEDVEYSEAEMGSIYNELEAHYQELFPFHLERNFFQIALSEKIFHSIAKLFHSILHSHYS